MMCCWKIESNVNGLRSYLLAVLHAVGVATLAPFFVYANSAIPTTYIKAPGFGFSTRNRETVKFIKNT